MSAINSYTDMAALIRDYIEQPIANYLNQSISINSVTLSCDVYRIADGSSLTSSVFAGCIANDANTQIIVGRNLKVASGVTLIPPYRCKGVFIGSPGVFTNSGTISMTARGASGTGKDIALINNYKISASGGAGGASNPAASNNVAIGKSGSSPSSGVLSCGGGGSGSAYSGGVGGAGGTGTSFSGGAGGGASVIQSSNDRNGSSTGGVGGTGTCSSFGSARAGAGNPIGTDNNTSDAASFIQNFDSNGTGTGGLLVIIANNINSSGSLSSVGSKGPGRSTGGGAYNFGGGASGGGCIVLLSNESSITGTHSVVGGAQSDVSSANTYNTKGGAGGDGVYSNIIVSDMILTNSKPLSLAITFENILSDIDPESGRLLALMDKDELMYEYNGIRHRAVRTDVDFTDFEPPTGRVPSGHGVPVGTTITFFGDTAPDGYLLMDGTEYLISDYPVLANHLLNMTTGSQYEGTDSSHFKVPNVLGEFPRFSGTNAHTNQGSGSTVGTHQDATAVDGNYQNVSDKVLRVGQVSAWNGGNRNGDSDLTVEGFTQYFTSSAQTINESNYTLQTVRPTNTSFLPCIKY